MSVHSQSQSLFVTRLPTEIREAIYLEIWRSLGLRQHIVTHPIYQENEVYKAGVIITGTHLSRWPCTTDFYVGDRFQEDAEGRCDRRAPRRHRYADITPDWRRTTSEWLNHWPCEEKVFELVYKSWDSELHEREENREFECWCTIKDERMTNREDAPSLGSYMAMLLSCKLVSSECLRSIYHSTTFIFTDAISIQAFFGSCEEHMMFRGFPDTKLTTPPAFRKYARNIELSLDHEWPLHSRCCWSMENREAANKMHERDWKKLGNKGNLCDDLKDQVHNAFDFHWLRLDAFDNLQSVKIWISEFCYCWYDELTLPNGFEKMDIETLRASLSTLPKLDSVVLSIPSGKDVGSEDRYVDPIPKEGYVDGITEGGWLKVWERRTSVLEYYKGDYNMFYSSD